MPSWLFTWCRGDSSCGHCLSLNIWPYRKIGLSQNWLNHGKGSHPTPPHLTPPHPTRQTRPFSCSRVSGTPAVTTLNTQQWTKISLSSFARTNVKIPLSFLQLFANSQIVPALSSHFTRFARITSVVRSVVKCRIRTVYCVFFADPCYDYNHKSVILQLHGFQLMILPSEVL